MRSGEEAAFEELVRTHGGRLLAVARRYLPSEDDARDAVQDAFLSAFKALPAFEGQAKLSTWLHRIAVNAALMKLRTRRRKPEQSIDDLLPGFLEDGHLEKPASEWMPVPLDLVERKEIAEIVRSNIARLPDNHRHVLLLRDIEEFDTEETAEMLEITPNAVKTRLHRARLALRELLEPHLRRSPE
ncbi:MAG: sigma-70 family RNA polymerase sigma factor [Myxococcales bacterium]|nr:sigma-70 family RNA polymerase sigma factor [Myxococcales bacterium]